MTPGIGGDARALRILGSGAQPEAERLRAAAPPGTHVVLLAGSAADPADAAGVTRSVVDLFDALQAISSEAASAETAADVVIAVVTPAAAAPATVGWRQALDEAVVGITQSLTREYVPDVLRVNAVLGRADYPDDVVASIEFLSHEGGAFAVGATVGMRT